MAFSHVGYKIVRDDYTSPLVRKGEVWTVGSHHKLVGEPKLCHEGFHFCPRAIDCAAYVFGCSCTADAAHGYRLLRVGVPDGATVVSDGRKHVSNELVVIEEVGFWRLTGLVRPVEGNGWPTAYVAGRDATGLCYGAVGGVVAAACVMAMSLAKHWFFE
jgi:hypothetical protein